MSETTSLHEDKVRRYTHRLAQLQAQTFLRDKRLAARQRTKQRRETAQRRAAFGDVVMAAGFAEWSEDELLGMLLAARDHFGTSATARRLHAHRAMQHRTAPTPSLH